MGGYRPLWHTIIIRAAPSALTVVGAFLLPLLMVGMIEASATRRLEVPWTRLSVAQCYRPSLRDKGIVRSGNLRVADARLRRPRLCELRRPGRVDKASVGLTREVPSAEVAEHRVYI
jgi:hypothetical protein